MAVVQPDVVFFQAGNEPSAGDKNFAGIPDLVAEVLSPDTRRRDRTVKLQAYQDARVPEYWLVDPRDRTVEVHVLSPDMRYTEPRRGVEVRPGAVLDPSRLRSGGRRPVSSPEVARPSS